MFGYKPNTLSRGVKKVLSEHAVGSYEPDLAFDFIDNEYTVVGGTKSLNTAVTHSRSGNATMVDGYGPELVTNGTFDSDLTGWSNSIALVSWNSPGYARVDRNGGTFSDHLYQDVSTTPGVAYVVTFNIIAVSNAVDHVFNGINTGSVSATGSYSRVFVATSSTARIAFAASQSTAATFSIDNISVREMPVLKWAPHNLLTYSEDFSNAAWTKSNVTITPNATTAPDGTQTADKLVTNATSGTTFVYDGVTIEANNTVVVFAKAGEYTNLRVIEAGSFHYYASFDLETGAISASGGVNFVSASALDVGNGWYRCEIKTTKTTTQSPSFGGFPDGSEPVNTPANYAGDGVSGIYIWGAHLYRSDLGGMVDNPERGDSYVPTTSAAAYLPRIGHHEFNGYEWVNKGLLAESEARTNLITYSEDFSNAVWGKPGSAVTANDAASPDGLNNAFKLESLDSAPSSYLSLTSIFTSGVGYVVSIYAKAGTASWLRIANASSGSTGAWFDLSTGTVGIQNDTAAAGNTAAIEDVGNGWYRCIRYFASATAPSPEEIIIGVNLADGSTAAPAAGEYVHVYGAQAEAGSVPSSYVPTSGATATRAAETFTVPAANLPWPQPEYAVSEFGPELVTNGGFDTGDLTDFNDVHATGSFSVVSNQLSVNYTGSGPQFLEIKPNGSHLPVGLYMLEIEYVSGTSLPFYSNALVSYVQGEVIGNKLRYIFWQPAQEQVKFVVTGSGQNGIYDNISVRELTAELVANGSFASDSNWTKGTGWTISGGAATHSAGTGSNISQAVSLTAGKLYKATVDVVAVSGGTGSIQFRNGGTTTSTTISDLDVGTTVSVLYVAEGNQDVAVQSGASTTITVDNISVREINPLSVSIAMKGEMDYADTGDTELTWYYWFASSGNYVQSNLRTQSTATGELYTLQAADSVADDADGRYSQYASGLNVPFDIASRHGSTFVNGAAGGVALTADTTPTALADLSSTDLSLAYDFMGTISEFRIWDKDLGDSGIEEATEPSTEPTLSLTFDGQSSSFTDTGYLP